MVYNYKSQQNFDIVYDDKLVKESVKKQRTLNEYL